MSPKSRSVRLTLLCTAVAGVLVAAAVGCQTYDFEPVEPLAISQQTKTQDLDAKGLKANLYLVVDKSGSMNGPTDPSLAACKLSDGGTCGPTSLPTVACDPTVCPTRWSDLSSAMHGFLTTSGTLARMGLTLYPASGGNLCGRVADGGSLLQVDVAPNDSNDDEASLTATAQAIDTVLQGVVPKNGTPTSEALAFADQTLGPIYSKDRDTYILLLTDGLPNCNPDVDQSTCVCTEVQSVCQSYPTGDICLDQDGTVGTISGLAEKGTRTIVLGFGADTASGDGPAVLTAMANAGGYIKRCPDHTDAECGSGDTCDVATELCNKPYFQASSGADLAAALSAIAASIPKGDQCFFEITEMPSDPSVMSVIVNGTETPSGPDTWSLEPDHPVDHKHGIEFQGAMCDAIKASNSSDPYKVSVQTVKSL